MKIKNHLTFMFFVAFITPLYFRYSYSGLAGVDLRLVGESLILSGMVTGFYWLLCLGVGDDR